MNLCMEVKEFDNDIQRAIGTRIQDARIKKGLAGADVAAYLNITTNSYSRIERGETKCKLEYLFILCQILEVTSDYLLFGKKEDGIVMTKEQLKAIEIMKVAFA